MKNLLLALLVLIVSTLLYSINQEVPAKVIGHPITTFFAALFFAFIPTFIMKKKSEKSFFELYSKMFFWIVIALSVGKNLAFLL